MNDTITDSDEEQSVQVEHVLEVRMWRGGGIAVSEKYTNERWYFHQFGQKTIDGQEYGNVLVYCGRRNHPTNYWESKSTDSVPEEVLEKVAENEGVVVAENVDAGWDDWNGRPEFSENYHDFSQAEIVHE